MSSRPRFEIDAKGNSEMAYSKLRSLFSSFNYEMLAGLPKTLSPSKFLLPRKHPYLKITFIYNKILNEMIIQYAERGLIIMNNYVLL